MSRIGEYEVRGPADPRAVARARALDYAAGAFLAMLGFPFPVVRAGAPTAVFVSLILAALVFGAWLYTAIAAVVLGRTPGMYLFDLGFAEGRPSPASALLWAVTSSERLSGLRLGASAERAAP